MERKYGKIGWTESDIVRTFLPGELEFDLMAHIFELRKELEEKIKIIEKLNLEKWEWKRGK